MADKPPPVVEARGLGYRFGDGVWAFRGVDLSLRSGEITVLAGRNGAGKTMLAKHLAGLLAPTEGEVLVGGEKMPTSPGRVAREVGYVFQDARLQAVGDTVRDDVLFGPTCLGLPKDEAGSRAADAISRCGLEDKASLFVHELSGGELRRLAVASLLALRPRALLLDEPFANLDPQGVGAVLRLARDLAADGIAILVITHEIEKALGIARRFVVMDSGRIALSGSPEEVLKRGVESFGLRDPFRPRNGIEDLAWF